MSLLKMLGKLLALDVLYIVIIWVIEATMGDVSPVAYGTTAINVVVVYLWLKEE